MILRPLQSMTALANAVLKKLYYPNLNANFSFYALSSPRSPIRAKVKPCCEVMKNQLQ